MKTGRPPRSAEAKIAAGNPGRRPIVDDSPGYRVSDSTDPHRETSQAVGEMYEAIAAEMIAAGTLYAVSTDVLLQYCQTVTMAEVYYLAIRSLGDRTAEGAEEIIRPYMSTWQSLIRQATRLASELGITPVTMGRARSAKAVTPGVLGLVNGAAAKHDPPPPLTRR